MSSSSFVAVRVREGVPGSPRALVSAPPHPQAVALDRRDTVVGRRAPLDWRACGGTRRVTCAWLQAVDRSFLAPSRRQRVMFVLISNVYANRMTRPCRQMSPETTACEIATALRNYRDF